MDLKYVSRYGDYEDAEPVQNHFSLMTQNASKTEPLDIRGYQYMIADFQALSDDHCNSFQIDSALIRICYASSSNTLTISGLGDPITIGIDTMIHSLQARGSFQTYQHPAEDLTQLAENRNLRCKIVWSDITGNIEGNTIEYTYMKGMLFLGKK
jgi:hypothetical protein